MALTCGWRRCCAIGNALHVRCSAVGAAHPRRGRRSTARRAPTLGADGYLQLAFLQASALAIRIIRPIAYQEAKTAQASQGIFFLFVNVSQIYFKYVQSLKIVFCNKNIQVKPLDELDGTQEARNPEVTCENGLMIFCLRIGCLPPWAPKKKTVSSKL